MNSTAIGMRCTAKPASVRRTARRRSKAARKPSSSSGRGTALVSRRPSTMSTSLPLGRLPRLTMGRTQRRHRGDIGLADAGAAQQAFETVAGPHLDGHFDARPLRRFGQRLHQRRHRQHGAAGCGAHRQRAQCRWCGIARPRWGSGCCAAAATAADYHGAQRQRRGAEAKAGGKAQPPAPAADLVAKIDGANAPASEVERLVGADADAAGKLPQSGRHPGAAAAPPIAIPVMPFPACASGWNNKFPLCPPKTFESLVEIRRRIRGSVSILPRWARRNSATRRMSLSVT